MKKNKIKSSKHGVWASVGSSFTALCCAGSPVVLAFLTGAGFGFLINDFILFPLLFISLGFMYYALRHNKKKHLSFTPMYIALVSALVILGGIFLKLIIWFGIAGLFVATIWDFILIKKCKKCGVENE